jgi:hypothetical protein
LRSGLEASAALWPAIALLYAWVWRVAHVLGENGPNNAVEARRQLGGLLGAMVRHGMRLGALAGAAAPFVRVSRSYGAGLFCCYEVADLPRTNNALEQFFGSHRYHECRASGRKGASPGLVVRGQARLLAAAVTRQRAFSASELAGVDRERREALRRQMESRRQRRVQRRRFRRDPQAYLQALEEQLLQSTLRS